MLLLRIPALAFGVTFAGFAISASAGDLEPCQEYSRSEAVFVGVAGAPVKRWVRLPGHDPLQMTLTPIQVERAYLGVSTPVMYLTPLAVQTRPTPGVRYLVYGRHYNPPDIVMASPGFGAKEVEHAASDLAYLDGVSPAGHGGTVSGLVLEQPLTLDAAQRRAAPLDGIAVRIVNDEYASEAVTDADGRFVATGIPTGRYKLLPQLPEGLVVRDPISTPEIEVRDGGCAKDTIDVVSNGRVRGLLRGPDGRPLSLTLVDLMPMDVTPAPPFGEVRGTTSVETDGNGEFEFAGRPAGRYYLGVNLYHAPSEWGASYPRTYYPGTINQAEAVPVVIESGRDGGVYDFSISATLAKGELKVIVENDRPGVLDLCVMPLANRIGAWPTYGPTAGLPLTLPVVEGQQYQVHVHLRYPGGHLESAPYVFTATTGTTWVKLRPDEPRTLHP